MRVRPPSPKWVRKKGPGTLGNELPQAPPKKAARGQAPVLESKARPAARTLPASAPRAPERSCREARQLFQGPPLPHLEFSSPRIPSDPSSLQARLAGLGEGSGPPMRAGTPRPRLTGCISRATGATTRWRTIKKVGSAEGTAALSARGDLELPPWGKRGPGRARATLHLLAAARKRWPEEGRSQPPASPRARRPRLSPCPRPRRPGLRRGLRRRRRPAEADNGVLVPARRDAPAASTPSLGAGCRRRRASSCPGFVGSGRAARTRTGSDCRCVAESCQAALKPRPGAGLMASAATILPPR